MPLKKPQKILVVGSSPIEGRVTQMFLEAIGYEAVCAAIPTDLVGEVERTKPDVVLMDVDGSGERILVGDLPSRTWLILHSSRPLPELNELAKQLDADGVIEKTSNGGAFHEAFCLATGVPLPSTPPLPNPASLVLHSIPAPLRTGDKWIDAHHLILFKTCADYLARAKDAPVAETLVFLGFLERYASFHFAAEEQLMSPGTPATLEHKSEHSAFLVYVRQMKDMVDTDERPEHGIARTYAFVKLWISTHINVHDQALMH
jgi:hemerythrin-like metal-binding protein